MKNANKELVLELTSSNILSECLLVEPSLSCTYKGSEICQSSDYFTSDNSVLFFIGYAIHSGLKWVGLSGKCDVIHTLIKIYQHLNVNLITVQFGY